jgi:hypothetical protein
MANMKVDTPMTTRTRKGEEGAAMIMALLVSFLLLTASAGLLLEASMNAANVTDAVAEQQAYHAAESGIQSAVHILRCQKNANPGCEQVIGDPLYNADLDATHEANQINYSRAADPLTSNTTGQEADPARLSRFINYNSTCGPDADVLCVALNQNGYAYALEIDDPDNVSSFVSFSFNGRLVENDGGTELLSRTYAGATPDHWLKVSYTAPAAFTDYDMSGGPLTTSFGVLSITQGPSGGAIVQADNRFEVILRMTRPYDAVKSIRGWILKTNSANEIPKVIFDSQTLTFVGSAITLDLSATPSSGWSNIEIVDPPDPPIDNFKIGYRAQASLGNNVIGATMTPPEPVRLFIKSTGYGPRGARKELQAIIQKNFFNGLTAPAALTLVGPHRTGYDAILNPTAPVDEVASHFFFSLGQSAVLKYSGQDQVSTDIIPPIGTNNPQSLICVEDYILNVSPDPDGQCSDSYPNGSNPFHGEIQGSPTDVTVDMPYWLQSPAALDREIHKLAGTARSSGRFFANGVTPSGLGNFASGTGITFCDGDVEVSNNGAGATGDGGGILVVTGKLTIRGAWNFKGLIIVTGPEGIDRSGGGGGDAEITGNVVVAPYVNNKIVDSFDIDGNPVDDPAGIFLAPHYNMDGGGNSNLQFNSQSLQAGLTAISNFVLGVMEK